MSKAKFTPAPWRWEVNKKHKSVTLCGGRPMFDIDVMRFQRYGMQDAQPTFCNGDYQGVKASDLAVEAKGREHHSDWFMLLKHPDAQLIEASPCMYEMLECILSHIEDDRSEDIAYKYNEIKDLLAKARGES